MTSKKLIILCLITVNTLVAQKNEFSLTGKTSDIEDNTYLYFRDLANGGNIDSALVRNNTFKFTTTLPEPVLFVMLFKKDKTKFTELWLENRPMTFDATKGDFKNAVVTGSRNHSLAKEMKDKVYANAGEISDDIKNQREKDFINKHPDALVSAYILTMANRRWNQQEIAEFYAKLSPEIQTSSIGQKVAKFLEKDMPEIGEKYMDFEISNKENKTQKLSELTGELTLIQFWSSTCAGSRMMNEKLRKIYEDYHPDGLNIISISKDNSRGNWIKAINEDNITWPQCSNLNGWDGEVFQAYGVSSTPSNILIDKNGIIIGKNLMSKDLKNKIIENLN
ncbi:TlpA disulfide reductase family protein [Salegentibacter flavus]|uniref:Peroxiredoxin n=1 Tax=Salegentibacter flavus TaxID=287099 RepID=A0A1I5CAD8_9FLAO|nr:TlpA disulfide reductase family protein [Salegentibacter flavus]SFN83846.1 Peroxiredoxin [Salegentibacter flavus]